MPWPETCGTETGIKKELLHDDGQGDESGVMDKYTASRFPHVRNIKMFVICLFLNPLAEIIWAASFILNREKE